MNEEHTVAVIQIALEATPPMQGFFEFARGCTSPLDT